MSDVAGVATEKKREHKKMKKGDITCFICEKQGHFARERPSIDAARTAAKKAAALVAPACEINLCACAMENAFTVEKLESYGIGRDDILLDNQASASIFCSKNLLRDIQKANRPILVSGVNGGVVSSDEQSHTSNFGPVY